MANSQKQKLRILLADDSKQMLELITDVLQGEFEIVGTVADGRSALDAIAQLEPDVVVLDVLMPTMDGIKAARQLRKTNSTIKIVFLSNLENADFVEAARESGGNAYVFKSLMGSDLARAIRAAMESGEFLSSELRSRKQHS